MAIYTVGRGRVILPLVLTSMLLITLDARRNPVIDRVRDGDREATAQHEVQRRRLVAFVEQHVAADQVTLVAGGGHTREGFRGSAGKEVGAGEGFFVGHDGRHGTTLLGCGAPRNPR